MYFPLLSSHTTFSLASLVPKLATIVVVLEDHLSGSLVEVFDTIIFVSVEHQIERGVMERFKEEHDYLHL